MSTYDKDAVLAKIGTTGLLPLFNFADFEICAAVIKACYAAGIRAFELTNRDEKAFEVFKKLVPFVKNELPELTLGAGTILDVVTAQKFIDAGADYIIAPNLDFGVGEVCLKNNIPWIPGCMTPSEFQQAYKFGSPLIKLFPGSILGPDYLKHILAPLPHLRVVVTGGVQNTAESINSWLKSGAFACGIGSQLFSKEIIQKKNFDEITVQLNKLIAGISR
ncbi:bifunctional 4-hydroxy-2-oxoglutarate aldolase/2-dehydro-3-deoxy-phosphogluconate aldolase [Pollutibacter soli]|uniref:bifunctional 4-hydroxy-2-oxoglutarate aldolase/2-dehydro-3-deoxy-phosphogluconate aldolase n=1 Tax=Pollutibacter soli TaxID=3034157 RepID=UPI003013EEDF